MSRESSGSMSVKRRMVVTSRRSIYLQRGKGDFCLSEFCKLKRNLHIASEFLKNVFFPNSIHQFPTAVGWVSPVLTYGTKVTAERRLSVRSTSHELYQPYG